MRISVSDRIAAPPAAVFPWIADPEKAKQWQKNVQGGEILTRTPEMVGTTFTEIIEENGKTLEMRGEITEYVENKAIAFHILSKIHEFDVRYAVHEIDGATRLSIETDIKWKFPMNLFSLFIGKSMEAGLEEQLQTEVLELKRLVESEQRRGQ